VTEQESTSRSLHTDSASGHAIDKLQRDNPTVANFIPQPGPHLSGAHRNMSIRILRPPRNSLSCRSKESLGRRLRFERKVQQTELILASILDGVHRLTIRMRHLAFVNIRLTL